MLRNHITETHDIGYDVFGNFIDCVGCGQRFKTREQWIEHFAKLKIRLVRDCQ